MMLKDVPAIALAIACLVLFIFMNTSPMHVNRRVLASYSFNDSRLIEFDKMRRQWQNPPARTGEYYLPPIPTRFHLPIILQEVGAQVGLEVGVQRGWFASHMLQNWPQCTKYYLVDLWQHQENYKDTANVDGESQQRIFEEAQEMLAPFRNKTQFMRMSSIDAATLVDDASIDFIFLDARHDYCAMKEDISAWWPKMKPGGIFAGHDYISHEQALPQDWTKCADGSIQPGAVKRAVDEFARKHQLIVFITYREQSRGLNAPSWIVRKPL